jgi:hypothetical protein
MSLQATATAERAQGVRDQSTVREVLDAVSAEG